jgi:hypothetical protein
MAAAGFEDIRVFDGKKFRLIYDGSKENCQKMAAKARDKGTVYARVVKESGVKGRRARHAVYARIE